MANLILTDIDETVLQFAEPFHDWMEARGYPGDGRLRDNYCMQRTFGIPKDEIEGHLHEFAHGTDWLSRLPPEDCAREVLPDLHRQGYRFVGITAIDPAFHERRLANLERAFGFAFLGLHCVGLGGDKREALSAYPKAIWVEDHWQHALTGTELGHRSFLLTRSYNRAHDDPRVTRVADWHAIRALLA